MTKRKQDTNVSCSDVNCAHPDHRKNTKLIDISDSDSDLLLTIADNSNVQKTKTVKFNGKKGNGVSSQQYDKKCDKTPKKLASYQKVGYSQCQSQRSQRKLRPKLDSSPPPFMLDKENENTDLVSPYKAPKPVKVLVTPDTGKKILVDDTPEHMAGLSMARRRLRQVYGSPIQDSQVTASND